MPFYTGCLKLVLPHPYHPPSDFLKRRRLIPVALPVRRHLPLPEPSRTLRRRIAPRAPVPEATVDEQRHLLIREDEIRAYTRLELRAITGDAHRRLHRRELDDDVPSPSRDTCLPEHRRDRFVGALVPGAADARHDL